MYFRPRCFDELTWSKANFLLLRLVPAGELVSCRTTQFPFSSFPLPFQCLVNSFRESRDTQETPLVLSPWPTGVELAGAVELRRCVVAQRRVEICRCYWPSLSRGQKCKTSCKRRNSHAQWSRIQPKLPTVLPLETPLNSGSHTASSPLGHTSRDLFLKSQLQWQSPSWLWHRKWLLRAPVLQILFWMSFLKAFLDPVPSALATTFLATNSLYEIHFCFK